MFAVIKTGGKQYLVSPGDKIKIEKLDKKEGEELVFDQVLLLEKTPSITPGQFPLEQSQLEIGKPLIKDGKVIGKVLKQGKGEKKIIFKYKAKKRYKVKKGHRQLYTEVEILKISSQGL